MAAAILTGVVYRAVGRGDRGHTPSTHDVAPADVVIGTPNAPPDDQILGVAIAPDGRCAATGTRGGRVVVRAATGEPLFAWQAHAEPVYALGFLSDSSAVLTAGRGGELRVWALAAGGPVLRAEVRDAAPVMSVAAFPDGKAIAVGSIGRVAVWRVGPDRLTPMVEFAAPAYPINALAVSPDGRSVAAGNSGDGCVWVWRLGGPAEAGRVDASPEYQVRGLRFTPDGGALVTVDSEGNVALADAGDPVRLWRLRGPAVRQAAFSRDGRRVIVAHLDGTARLTATPTRAVDH